MGGALGQVSAHLTPVRAGADRLMFGRSFVKLDTSRPESPLSCPEVGRIESSYNKGGSCSPCRQQTALEAASLWRAARE
jgi:hypothetical protein